MVLVTASEEFVALCQSQVKVIQELGATLSAVYLTAELAEDAAKLIPIVAYPTAEEVWERWETGRLLPEDSELADGVPWLPSADAKIADDSIAQAEGNAGATEELNTLWQQRRIVLPLMHEGLVMGLLVTERSDRAWNPRERSQLEQIAHTMAIACILDRRRSWFEQQFTTHRQLQAQQHDLLHKLLHQLKNPLTALRTFTKLLLRRLGMSDPNREIAGNILRESDRIAELLQQFDQVLELSDRQVLPSLPPANDAADPAQSASKPLLLLPASSLIGGSLESVSVQDVLEPLLTSARAIALERYLEIDANLPSNLPPLLANFRALREVLNNLIDNALKYTPAGGKIYIVAGQERKTTTNEWLGISVADTGPGIPPQDLEHLFEKSYRGVQAETDIPGTGLGLAIVKELVEQMQGEIEVITPAQKDGKGVKFVVWLRKF
jgi:signal transduction histidine kinase